MEYEQYKCVIKFDGYVETIKIDLFKSILIRNYK